MVVTSVSEGFVVDGLAGDPCALMTVLLLFEGCVVDGLRKKLNIMKD